MNENYYRSNKTIMKTYSYSSRKALILMGTCLLLVSSRYTVNQAMAAGEQSRSVAAAGSASEQSVKDRARLIIRRNVGNDESVDLYVDGVAITDIGFGHTYEGFLSPGRHVLSVQQSPPANWATPVKVTLEVRNGQTYSFTVIGDHSGDLLLNVG
jgi:hypothetical protein